MNRPYRFILVGAGWRAGFFMRTAQWMPERFTMLGVVCASPRSEAAARDEWHTRVFSSIAEAAAEKPDFLIAAIPADAIHAIAVECMQYHLPVMFETFLAKSVEELQALYQDTGHAPILVAEQYPFQPMHAARIRIANSGALGKAYHARVSFVQNYHTLAVLRRLLNVSMERPLVHGFRQQFQRAAGPTRAGDPTSDALQDVSEEFFLLDYGDRVAIGDYESMQQRSWFRTPTILVRAERGEIVGEKVTRLKDRMTPYTYDLRRVQTGLAGNLEGFSLRGIMAGDQWLYENPYYPMRLADDEIAVACCMDGMAAFLAGEKPFYALREALQDQYISLLIQQSIQEGRPIQAEKQPWQSD